MKALVDVQRQSVTAFFSGRELLTANRTYYVATTGSDSNDGLSAGSPFLTIQKAVDTVASLDIQGVGVTVSVANGAYNANVALKDPVSSAALAGPLTLQGNAASPDSVTITAATPISSSGSRLWAVNGFKLQSSSGNCVDVNTGSLALHNVNFGSAVAAHIYIQKGASVTVNTNYTIAGDAQFHFYSDSFGAIVCNSRTITLSGSRAFTYFAYAPALGYMNLVGNTFTGSATGNRYVVSANSVMITGGLTLPGNAAGIANTGGQYS